MRRPTLKELREVTGREVLPRASDPGFAEKVARAVGTAIHPGHQIELLVDNGRCFELLWNDLAGAGRSILLQVYFATEGEVTRRTVAALADRAQAGVDVRLLADAFGARELLVEYGEELREAGVRVAEFRPLRFGPFNRTHHRAHSRIVVIDDRLAYTGGFGLDDRWLRPVDGLARWREVNVRFSGPAVDQARTAFRLAWETATGEADGDGGADPGPPPGTEGVRAGLLYATPRSDATAAERFLAFSIEGSRRTFYAANPYFLPGRGFRELLKEAAGRGVDVRILTVGPETDVPIVRWASRGIYEDLLEGGVQIWEYRGAMMHAKTLVVDEVWATVGSMNFDNRSLRLNEEVNLLVHDADVASRLHEEFLSDLEHAEEIRLESFRERPLGERVLERVTRVGEALL